DLQVLLRSTVRGHVQDNFGRPLENIIVRLVNRDPNLMKASVDARTNEDGDFLMPAVGPGTYRVRAFPGFSKDKEHEAATLSNPLTYDIEIMEGQDHILDPLIFGQGAITLIGRVHDQYGQPFQDLDVLVYRNVGERPTWSDAMARGKTNAHGVYEVGPFQPEPVQVQIAPMGYLPSNERNLLKRYIEPITLDLRGKVGTAHAPDAIGLRSEPFEIQGELVSQSGRLGRGIRVEVFTFETEKTDRLDIKPARDQKHVSFKWITETPYPQIELRIKQLGKVVRSESFLPHPNETITGLAYYLP
ncbi:MAG: carboxypeptidase-like regulatory domain-containing protein, partial [Planctomycetes bacterium]|nr:carboxypeptidase-like regulatory domain-containing protein [Planctomycetota bacterium]